MMNFPVVLEIDFAAGKATTTLQYSIAQYSIMLCSFAHDSPALLMTVFYRRKLIEYGLSEVVPVPRFPIESIRFVTTVMDCVKQGSQLGGCAHEEQGGSPKLHFPGGRLAQIVTPRLDFANEACGVWQIRDRLQVCERVRDQLD